MPSRSSLANEGRLALVCFYSSNQFQRELVHARVDSNFDEVSIVRMSPNSYEFLGRSV